LEYPDRSNWRILYSPMITKHVHFNPFDDPDVLMIGVMDESAELVIDHIEKLMKKPKTGRFYGTHRASAPGEAPAITGDSPPKTHLIDLFDVQNVDSLSAMVVNELGVEGEGHYGYILQEHRNRPFSEEAVENAWPEIEELIEDRIDRWQF